MSDTHQSPDPGLLLSSKLAGLFQNYSQVEAVILCGSRTSGTAVDARSDVDLVVYSETGDFPLEDRRAVVEQLGGAARASLGLGFLGTADAWLDMHSGIEVDVVYTSQRGIEEELNQILVQHKPKGGYSTCVWHSVRTARILFDRNGWFKRLQTWSDQPYPPELRQAIIRTNFPGLRDTVPSYRDNIEKSLPRNDLIFITNEVTWMLANYFDVLFAFNNVPHPGAKRMLAQVTRLCPRQPRDMARQVTRVLQLAPTGNGEILAAIDELVDGLEALLGDDAPGSNVNASST